MQYAPKNDAVAEAAKLVGLAATAYQPSVYKLLSNSPLTDMALELGSVHSPVRDVEL
jgi:hypothetical protein